MPTVYQVSELCARDGTVKTQALPHLQHKLLSFLPCS